MKKLNKKFSPGAMPDTISNKIPFILVIVIGNLSTNWNVHSNESKIRNNVNGYAKNR